MEESSIEGGGITELCHVEKFADEINYAEADIEGVYDDGEYEEETVYPEQPSVSSRQNFTTLIQSNATQNGSVEEKQQNTDDNSVYLYREISFLLESSLSEMNRNPDASVVRMKEWVPYGLFEDNLNQKKTKENASHLITGMWLTAAKNDFNATFAISPIGVEIPTFKRLSDSGVCGACVIEAGANFRNSMIPIFDASKMKTESPLLRKYPDRNLDNLSDGISYVGGRALVAENHPVLEYFNAARQKKGLTSLGPQDQSEQFPGNYVVAQNDTQKCMEELKKNWEKGSKRNNLYNLGFRFERAFLSGLTQNDSGFKEGLDISKKTITGNGIAKRSLKKTLTSSNSNTDIHDGREIFFGITSEEPKRFIASDPKKCFITVLVKYKQY